ncbi:MAG TPA: response regulator [Thermoanaerobaculia bacterium]|nr:response regulator [Thermoanaerobaculia bacterium]
MASVSDRGPGVLVVDDDPANLLTVEAALGNLASSVVTVRSGRAALRRLLTQDFAVILLDVQMPGLDGFQTAELIRRRPRLRHVPIIFVTAHYRDEDDILRGYALGAVDFLFKPIVLEVLRSKVSVFVQLQDRAAQIRQQAEQLLELERLELIRSLAAERQEWEAEALRQESRRKDDFLALLGHELRNPLSPLVTGLELIGGYGIGHEGLDRTCRAMDRQVRQLIRLVDDLLDVSRISRGQITLQRGPVDLAQVVDHAVQSLRPVIAEYEHELVIEDGGALLAVDGDEVRLAQVITNLVNNAARYTAQGGLIRVTLERDGDSALLRVADNGRGISPEMLERVFDPYVREETTGPGMGLGLPLVRQLVTIHGGTVEVASPGRGKGAEFRVRLPLLQTVSQLDVRAQPSSAAEPCAAVDGLIVDAPLDVVVVEDEKDLREALQELLTAWGHRVRVAEDGEKGLAEILADPPAVALVDVCMPGLDGYSLATRVRAALGTASPTLVALTGFGRAEDRSRSRQAGFDTHLVKPARAEQLRRVLRRRGDVREDGVFDT